MGTGVWSGLVLELDGRISEKCLCTQNPGVPEMQGPRGSRMHPELAEYGRTASSEN